ncbi:hypothetical protein C4K26_2424 [Pseudomonas chlororaphis]|nr:hypothetical protein C4K26_2424 [Pseudomonas chlororaphis]
MLHEWLSGPEAIRTAPFKQSGAGCRRRPDTRTSARDGQRSGSAKTREARKDDRQ